ncbi:phosphoserine phosphatase SerB [Candidatus Methylopumilus rimovensis]|jgi:phosphoserine phosphatase|uniref:phosphoserine phosphatase SerB n=1 Tax=Candidatus Methylopumilus rimovensis TaxID=2588535 RepID=UPI00112283FF|nr:phosphoserine phosphatase SerB [Candidatus Methylopumilus rimovensis]QDD12445.1 phosphoserine phosphatase SerB [Candidatus Methylopumilus rimovensis]
MKLLIQSSYSFQSHLAEISEILDQVTASPCKLINDNAAIYDISDDLSGDLKNQLHLKNIDFAILDSYKALNEFSLCVMDMDSTLISIECIDEIADMCGKKEDVALITKSAMMGEIDFSQSLIKRVSLLEGLGEEMLFKVIEERLKFNEGTQAWVKACRKNNVTTVLVSGGFDYFADYVKNKLGIDVAISNQLEIKDKKLTGKVLGRIVNDEVKAQTVRDFQSKLNIDRSKTIVIGDGANDLKMLAEAQYSIAYHAKPIVQEKARFKFNHSDFKGVLNLFKI